MRRLRAPLRRPTPPYLRLAALILIFYIVGVTEKVSHAVLWGMAFGFGWFVTGISWVYYSMYTMLYATGMDLCDHLRLFFSPGAFSNRCLCVSG